MFSRLKSAINTMYRLTEIRELEDIPMLTEFLSKNKQFRNAALNVHENVNEMKEFLQHGYKNIKPHSKLLEGNKANSSPKKEKEK